MEPWWQSGVLYQIYPRSFADSDGDGIGDLRGIMDHLDHLHALGIDGVWLSPVTVSPNADWGYDVADYTGIQFEYGTLDDLDALVAKAGSLGIRILMDLVPNHTSDEHPWFVDSRSGLTARHRDWYVWADPKADGSEPNNWISHFGGPAWTIDDATGQYYLHNFTPGQPDLNWWNEDVRAAFDDILRFWFDRGVAGFRIDVCNMIVKDRELRDNPPATESDTLLSRLFGQQWLYNTNRPEVHDVIRRWRRVADGYDPPRLLLGETNVHDVEILCTYYGNGSDELGLGFNFPFINAPFDAASLRGIVASTEALLPDGGWPVWTGSNHDVSRFASRWAGGDPAKIRLALMMLLTLRGTPVLYQGDEIGLVDTELTKEDLKDPVGLRFWPVYPGRDPVRTPMPWRNEPGGGFTAADATPWLPFGDIGACNVADQDGDPASTLTFTRDLIALRRSTPGLQLAAYETLPSPEGTWVWRRGNAITVALNFSDAPATIDAVTCGRIAITSDRARDGESVIGALTLAPWHGAIVMAPSLSSPIDA